MSLKYPAKCGAVMIGDPLNEADIVAFEQSLGTQLPEDYHDFLLEWNGVKFLRDNPRDSNSHAAAYPTQPIDSHSPHVPDWSKWTFDETRTDDGVGVVGLLYSLNGTAKGGGIDLRNANINFGFDQWVPQRFHAIGEVANGFTLICISLSGEDRGHVYDWAFPEGEELLPGENCPSMDHMYWIAPSFQEFWSVLRGMKEDEWPI